MMPVRCVTLEPNVPMTVTAPPEGGGVEPVPVLMADDPTNDREFNAVAVFVPDPAATIVHVSLTSTDPEPWGDNTYAVPGGSRRCFTWGNTTGSSVRLFATASVDRVEVEFS